MGWILTFTILILIAFGKDRKRYTTKQFQRQMLYNTLCHKVALNKEINDVIKKYEEVLCRKYKQTHYIDDYGKTIKDGWYKEVVYFFNNVMLNELSSTEGLEVNKILEHIDNYIHDVVSETNSSEYSINQKADIKTGIDYENFIESILNNADFKVARTPTTGDQGVDLVAIKNTIKIAIQCKFYSKPVGNKAVQEVIAGRDFYECDYACVVSNNSFTSAARKLANVSDIKLVSECNIVEELNNVVGIANDTSIKFNPKDMVIKSLIKEEYDSYTPLIKACANEDIEIVKTLLKDGANINEVAENGDTALVIACSTENTEIVKMLIAAGANIKKDGGAALTIVICTSGNVEIAKALIEAGADVNYESNNMSVLMHACFAKNTEIVKLLVEAGADVNFEYNGSYTPLACASVLGNVEIAKVLIKAGADVNYKNNNGLTLLAIASNGTSVEIIDTLFKSGAKL